MSGIGDQREEEEEEGEEVRSRRWAEGEGRGWLRGNERASKWDPPRR